MSTHLFRMLLRGLCCALLMVGAAGCASQEKAKHDPVRADQETRVAVARRLTKLRSLMKEHAVIGGNESTYSHLEQESARVVMKDCVVRFDSLGWTAGGDTCVMENGGYVFEGTPVLQLSDIGTVGEAGTSIALTPNGQGGFSVKLNGPSGTVMDSAR